MNILFRICDFLLSGALFAHMFTMFCILQSQEFRFEHKVFACIIVGMNIVIWFDFTARYIKIVNDILED